LTQAFHADQQQELPVRNRQLEQRAFELGQRQPVLGAAGGRDGVGSVGGHPVDPGGGGAATRGPGSPARSFVPELADEEVARHREEPASKVGAIAQRGRLP
jgi:hypothetical protein